MTPSDIDYRVIVTDQVSPALVGNPGVNYQSMPHPHAQALALACVLLGVPRLPDEHGPWRQALPGGRRTVSLEPVP